MDVNQNFIKSRQPNQTKPIQPVSSNLKFRKVYIKPTAYKKLTEIISQAKPVPHRDLLDLTVNEAKTTSGLLPPKIRNFLLN